LAALYNKKQVRVVLSSTMSLMSMNDKYKTLESEGRAIILFKENLQK
jgi:hypothetical protein